MAGTADIGPAHYGEPVEGGNRNRSAPLVCLFQQRQHLARLQQPAPAPEGPREQLSTPTKQAAAWCTLKEPALRTARGASTAQASRGHWQRNSMMRTKSVVIWRYSAGSHCAQQVQATRKRFDRYIRFGATSASYCIALDDGHEQQKRRRVLQQPRGLTRLDSVDGPGETWRKRTAGCCSSSADLDALSRISAAPAAACRRSA